MERPAWACATVRTAPLVTIRLGSVAVLQATPGKAVAKLAHQGSMPCTARTSVNVDSTRATTRRGSASVQRVSREEIVRHRVALGGTGLAAGKRASATTGEAATL